MVATKAPSRGVRASAITTRYLGCFLAPTRRSLIRSMRVGAPQRWPRCATSGNRPQCEPVIIADSRRAAWLAHSTMQRVLCGRPARGPTRGRLERDPGGADNRAPQGSGHRRTGPYVRPARLRDARGPRGDYLRAKPAAEPARADILVG